MFDSPEASNHIFDLITVVALFALLMLIILQRRQMNILKEMIDNQHKFTMYLAKVVEKKIE